MEREWTKTIVVGVWVSTLVAIGHDAKAAKIPCVGGLAGSYRCSGIDLLAQLPLGSMGGGSGNDIWGWTDPLTGKEYALMGRSNGTAFVDVSNPESPVYLGNLPTQTSSSSWRDIKVFQNHAFIVSEASAHGMQVFDLLQLRSVPSPPTSFSATAHYSGFGSAHNIVVNEATGFAYAVGAGGGTTCSGGLHMIDITVPTSPTFAGCFSSDGYTHDAQCVIYQGPDADYRGREICFNSNEDTLTIVDVTNKSAATQISRTGYAGRAYAHQGWLTDDHRHFLLDDELDERNFGHPTRTYIWDVSDLDAPFVQGAFTNTTDAIDHNQYVRGRYVYQANYTAGLRILDLTQIGTSTLSEVAYFDVYTPDDQSFTASHDTTFDGAWSVYPYFDSGNVIVSSLNDGLFVLQPRLTALGGYTCDLSARVTGGTLTGDFAIGAGTPVSWNLFLTSFDSIVPVWSGVSLPAIDPAVSFTLDDPSFPALGTIGLLMTLVTSEEGIVCSTFVEVDSGAP